MEDIESVRYLFQKPSHVIELRALQPNIHEFPMNWVRFGSWMEYVGSLLGLWDIEVMSGARTNYLTKMTSQT